MITPHDAHETMASHYNELIPGIKLNSISLSLLSFISGAMNFL